MNRTLTTLGLTLSLLGGCADSPSYSADPSDRFTNGNFCALPDPAECDLYFLDASAEARSDASQGSQDAGIGHYEDASQPSYDATFLTDGGEDASAQDASVAMDAGIPPETGVGNDDPCYGYCEESMPGPATCGDGSPSRVVCRTAFFGNCAWHFECGAP